MLMCSYAAHTQYAQQVVKFVFTCFALTLAQHSKHCYRHLMDIRLKKGITFAFDEVLGVHIYSTGQERCATCRCSRTPRGLRADIAALLRYIAHISKHGRTCHLVFHAWGCHQTNKDVGGSLVRRGGSRAGFCFVLERRLQMGV